jgi:hypothetical protein
MLEQMDESVRHLNVTLLERVNALAETVQKLEMRLPILPQ